MDSKELHAIIYQNNSCFLKTVYNKVAQSVEQNLNTKLTMPLLQAIHAQLFWRAFLRKEQVQNLNELDN